MDAKRKSSNRRRKPTSVSPRFPIGAEAAQGLPVSRG